MTLIAQAQAEASRPHSKRFATEKLIRSSRQRLECGRLASAFETMDLPPIQQTTGIIRKSAIQ